MNKYIFFSPAFVINLCLLLLLSGVPGYTLTATFPEIVNGFSAIDHIKVRTDLKSVALPVPEITVGI